MSPAGPHRSDRRRTPAEEAFDLSAVLPYVIVRTGVELDRAFTAAMAGIGLTTRHFGILSQFAGGHRPTAAEIARTLGITPQAVGPQIDQLRRRGLIDSIPRSGRGAPNELSLTDRGTERLAEALAVARSEQERLLDGLSEDQRQTMLAQLQVIARRAAGAEAIEARAALNARSTPARASRRTR